MSSILFSPLVFGFASIGVIGAVVLLNRPIVVTYLLIAYCCVFRYFVSSLGLPEAITYLTDLLVLFLFAQMLLGGRLKINANIRKPVLCVSLFFLVAVISFVGNFIGDSFQPILFVWAIRAYGRHYLFMLLCIVFLNRQCLDSIFNLLLFLLPINALFSAYQYFVLNLNPDDISGMFGTYYGNGSMNLYLVVVASIIMVRYVSRHLSLPYAIGGLTLILFIAAVSELKGVFFEVPVLLACSLLFAHNKRAVSLVGWCVLLVPVAISFFMFLYPSWSDFFSANEVKSYTTDASYAGSESVNRLTAGSYMFENALKTPAQKIFGAGPGSSEVALGRTSRIYQEYKAQHYEYFLYARIISGTGIAGFLLYLSFFVAVFVDSIRVCMLADSHRKHYCIISAMVSVMALFLVVYNQSLRGEVAYIFYLVLASPYIVENEIKTAARQSRPFHKLYEIPAPLATEGV